MDQGLVMIGADKRVQVHNRRARDLLGLSQEVLYEGASFAAVRHHPAQGGAFREAQAAMEQGDFPLEVLNRVWFPSVVSG
jgi:PAS domain-containing protein